MRVLLSVYAVSPSRGGEPGNSWKLACALAERGIDVDVLCTPPDRGDAERIAAAPARLRVIPVGSYVPPADPSNVVVEYWQYVRWQWRSVAVARAEMSRVAYDLVHHYSWGSLLWGSPLVRLGVPVLYGPVGGGVVMNPAARAGLGWRTRLRELLRTSIVSAVRFDPLARATVRRARTVVHDASTARLVERMGGEVDPVYRLQDTLAPEWFEHEVAPLVARRPRSVLWVARLIERKGPELALRSLAVMPPDVTLTMVGDGPLMARCRSLAEQLGVSDRVEFTGRVAHESFRELAASHCVFLFSPIRDTFGGQVVEAASQGTPVVAIRQHGIAEHLSESCGALVEPGGLDSMAESLATAVFHLLDDASRWSAASAAAREQARSFLLERVVDATIASYERLISECGARRPSGRGDGASGSG